MISVKQEARNKFIEVYAPVIKYGGINMVATLHEIADYWTGVASLLVKHAVAKERQRIIDALINVAEPYEDSMWLNNLSKENIINVVNNTQHENTNK